MAELPEQGYDAMIGRVWTNGAQSDPSEPKVSWNVIAIRSITDAQRHAIDLYISQKGPIKSSAQFCDVLEFSASLIDFCNKGEKK